MACVGELRPHPWLWSAILVTPLQNLQCLKCLGRHLIVGLVIGKTTTGECLLQCNGWALNGKVVSCDPSQCWILGLMVLIWRQVKNRIDRYIWCAYSPPCNRILNSNLLMKSSSSCRGLRPTHSNSRRPQTVAWMKDIAKPLGFAGEPAVEAGFSGSVEGT